MNKALLYIVVFIAIILTAILSVLACVMLQLEALYFSIPGFVTTFVASWLTEKYLGD